MGRKKQNDNTRHAKDRGAVWLLERFGGAFLRLVNIQGFTSWSANSSNIIAVKRIPDGLIQATYPNGSTNAHLFEIEGREDNHDGDRQLFEDILAIRLTRGIVCEAHEIVLRPHHHARIRGFHRETSESGNTTIETHCKVFRVYETPAEAILALGEVGLTPLIPASNYSWSDREMLQTCRDLIKANAEPQDKDSLLAITQVISGNSVDQEVIDEVFGEPNMLDDVIYDSPVFQASMNRMKARWREEFKQEAEKRATLQEKLNQRAEERVALKTAREFTRLVLETRFGSPQPDLAQALDNISVRNRLDDLHQFAVTCPDLNAFRAELAKSARA